MLFGFALPWNCSWHYRHPRQLLQQNSERFDILILAKPGCHDMGVVVSAAETWSSAACWRLFNDRDARAGHAAGCTCCYQGILLHLELLKSVEFRPLTKFIDMYSLMMPCAGTGVEIPVIGLIRFLSGCCKRWLNQAVSVLLSWILFEWVSGCLLWPVWLCEVLFCAFWCSLSLG